VMLGNVNNYDLCDLQRFRFQEVPAEDFSF
jgi:hypothetical protein